MEENKSDSIKINKKVLYVLIAIVLLAIAFYVGRGVLNQSRINTNKDYLTCMFNGSNQSQTNNIDYIIAQYQLFPDLIANITFVYQFQNIMTNKTEYNLVRLWVSKPELISLQN